MASKYYNHLPGDVGQTIKSLKAEGYKWLVDNLDTLPLDSLLSRIRTHTDCRLYPSFNERKALVKKLLSEAKPTKDSKTLGEIFFLTDVLLRYAYPTVKTRLRNFEIDPKPLLELINRLFFGSSRDSIQLQLQSATSLLNAIPKMVYYFPDPEGFCNQLFDTYVPLTKHYKPTTSKAAWSMLFLLIPIRHLSQERLDWLVDELDSKHRIDFQADALKFIHRFLRVEIGYMSTKVEEDKPKATMKNNLMKVYSHVIRMTLISKIMNSFSKTIGLRATVLGLLARYEFIEGDNSLRNLKHMLSMCGLSFIGACPGKTDRLLLRLCRSILQQVTTQHRQQGGATTMFEEEENDGGDPDDNDIEDDDDDDEKLPDAPPFASALPELRNAFVEAVLPYCLNLLLNQKTPSQTAGLIASYLLHLDTNNIVLPQILERLSIASEVTSSKVSQNSKLLRSLTPSIVLRGDEKSRDWLFTKILEAIHASKSGAMLQVGLQCASYMAVSSDTFEVVPEGWFVSVFNSILTLTESIEASRVVSTGTLIIRSMCMSDVEKCCEQVADIIETGCQESSTKSSRLKTVAKFVSCLAEKNPTWGCKMLDSLKERLKASVTGRLLTWCSHITAQLVSAAVCNTKSYPVESIKDLILWTSSVILSQDREPDSLKPLNELLKRSLQAICPGLLPSQFCDPANATKYDDLCVEMITKLIPDADIDHQKLSTQQLEHDLAVIKGMRTVITQIRFSKSDSAFSKMLLVVPATNIGDRLGQKIQTADYFYKLVQNRIAFILSSIQTTSQHRSITDRDCYAVSKMVSTLLTNNIVRKRSSSYYSVTQTLNAVCGSHYAGGMPSKAAYAVFAYGYYYKLQRRFEATVDRNESEEELVSQLAAVTCVNFERSRSNCNRLVASYLGQRFKGEATLTKCLDLVEQESNKDEPCKHTLEGILGVLKAPLMGTVVWSKTEFLKRFLDVLIEKFPVAPKEAVKKLQLSVIQMVMSRRRELTPDFVDSDIQEIIHNLTKSKREAQSLIALHPILNAVPRDREDLIPDMTMKVLIEHLISDTRSVRDYTMAALFPILFRKKKVAGTRNINVGLTATIVDTWTLFNRETDASAQAGTSPFQRASADDNVANSPKLKLRNAQLWRGVFEVGQTAALECVQRADIAEMLNDDTATSVFEIFGGLLRSTKHFKSKQAMDLICSIMNTAATTSSTKIYTEMTAGLGYGVVSCSDEQLTVIDQILISWVVSSRGLQLQTRVLKLLITYLGKLRKDQPSHIASVKRILKAIQNKKFRTEYDCIRSKIGKIIAILIEKVGADDECTADVQSMFSTALEFEHSEEVMADIATTLISKDEISVLTPHIPVLVQALIKSVSTKKDYSRENELVSITSLLATFLRVPTFIPMVLEVAKEIPKDRVVSKKGSHFIKSILSMVSYHCYTGIIKPDLFETIKEVLLNRLSGGIFLDTESSREAANDVTSVYRSLFPEMKPSLFNFFVTLSKSEDAEDRKAAASGLSGITLTHAEPTEQTWDALQMLVQLSHDSVLRVRKRASDSLFLWRQSMKECPVVWHFLTPFFIQRSLVTPLEAAQSGASSQQFS